MNTEEEKDETGKAKCTDFVSAFKGCKEMFEGMNKCCPDQNVSQDCSAMNEQMMKSMMGMCCGRKTDNQNFDEKSK